MKRKGGKQLGDHCERVECIIESFVNIDIPVIMTLARLFVQMSFLSQGCLI
jgi:hypothetical protein